MLKDVAWAEDRVYRTKGKHEPLEFYLDTLLNSTHFDLLLGYFSSAAISVLSTGFAKFLSSGGKMRMIVNNILSQKDKDVLINSTAQLSSSALFDLSDIPALKQILDDYGTHFFECLAWLISNNKIEIKVVKPKDGLGISHYKSGVFSDNENQICFKGSCNFTAFGLLENLEEITTFLSWEDNRSLKEVENQNLFFNNLFLGNSDIVEFVDAYDIQIAIQNHFGDKNINELIIQEKELLLRKHTTNENKKLKEIINRVEEELIAYIRKPKFPFIEGPRSYQKEAYEKWELNNYKGIFAMATGTGKTITSLNCLLNQFLNSKDKTYHALILVPTITLVEQWEKEAHAFNFQEIIKVSAKYDWQDNLGTMLSTAKRIPVSFIIISTYASFVKDKFQNIIKNFPTDTIFIADEGHNLASPIVLSKLRNITLDKRIGLSATPKRIYDPEGTKIMEEFFHDKEPYVFSFPMDKAIKDGILCNYYYYPHIVQLTKEEFKEYLEITKTLSRFYNSETNGFAKSEIVERLLLKRKRIIHKAENKLEKTKSILKKEFIKKGTIKYTFVYVPEGITEEVNEIGEGDLEEIRIINQYTREIGKIDESILVNQFTSGMKDRNEILKQFQSGDIHVIASMKCLDEGVDIPRAETAIFCSSTGNPRQFIQRRGRILRKHKEKHIATIHDLVVIPSIEAELEDSDTFKVERNLVKTELERVMYFASLALNPYETEQIFEEVCERYNLNIYTIQNELKTI